VASVWQLPVIFCIENNGYGLSTPTKEQYNCKDLADRGKGYGMDAFILDGNNILEVYGKMAKLAESLRKRPRPILVEFKTFRMRVHEEASGTKYVPNELLTEWEAKDPLTNYRNYLMQSGLLNAANDEEMHTQIRAEIEEGLQLAYAEAPIVANESDELNDVYQPFEYQHIEPKEKAEEIRFIDAVSQGLRQSMQRHKDLVIMGQDVAEYGGVFKITEGFVEEFGNHRVRNTPICESAIVEVGMGLSISGIKSVVEMQFADFVSS